MSNLFYDGGLCQADSVIRATISIQFTNDGLVAARPTVTRRPVSVHRLGRVIPLQGGGGGRTWRAADGRRHADDRVHLAG